MVSLRSFYFCASQSPTKPTTNTGQGFLQARRGAQEGAEGEEAEGGAYLSSNMAAETLPQINTKTGMLTTRNTHDNLTTDRRSPRRRSRRRLRRSPLPRSRRRLRRSPRPRSRRRRSPRRRRRSKRRTTRAFVSFPSLFFSEHT